MAAERQTASFVTLSEEKRQQAMARFAVLQPHLEDGVPLTHAASQAGVPIRTAERWLAHYHQDGLAVMPAPIGRDAGAHRP